MAIQKGSNRVARREFLAGAAAAAAVTIVRPSAVRGTEANSSIALGLLGCGGRGNWITDLFDKHGKYRWVACADYYQDHADKTGERLKIDSNHRYTTLSAYKKLLEDKVDAVVIETPPYFHPIHAAAAVEAGKHVYCAKPIAVDVPGCQSIGASGKKATEKKLVFLVDFQTRADQHYREAARLIHEEDRLGKLVCADAKYPCGVIGQIPPKTPEDRLRKWYCIREISGDFIVEQAIHALDVATWFLNADPISASGTGASKGLRRGNIYDHFDLLYKFPNDVPLTFHCVQMVNGAPNEICCRVYGSKGTVDSDYYTHVWIHGPKPYEGGTFKDMYTDGTVVNIKEFYEFVTRGDCKNLTVPQSVRSNLTAVLGRTAGYEKREVTWDEMIKANVRLEPDLTGLKS